MKTITAAVIAVEHSSVERAQSGAMLQAEEPLLATQPALWTLTSECQQICVHVAAILRCLFFLKNSACYVPRSLSCPHMILQLCMTSALHP